MNKQIFTPKVLAKIIPELLIKKEGVTITTTASNRRNLNYDSKLPIFIDSIESEKDIITVRFHQKLFNATWHYETVQSEEEIVKIGKKYIK